MFWMQCTAPDSARVHNSPPTVLVVPSIRTTPNRGSLVARMLTKPGTETLDAWRKAGSLA